MKYIFIKKIDNIDFIFDNFNFFLFNKLKNLNYKFFLNFNFFFLKKDCINNFYFQNFIERSKFLNILKKSFFFVTSGFCLHLELIGLGYSVTVKNKQSLLRFNIGFNHSVYYVIPKNIVIKTKRKRLYLFSYSFFLLKKVSIDLKNFRRLSIYKLKGIKDKNELYIKKN
jgi:hypothetical protein